MRAKAGISSTPTHTTTATTPTKTVTTPTKTVTVTVTTPAPPTQTVTVQGPTITFHDSGAPTKSSSPVPLGGPQTAYDRDGNPLQVTAALIDPAISSELVQPASGDRFVGVQLMLSNPGTATVSDDANIDTAIIGSDDQEYGASFDSLSGCTNFDFGEFNLQPGVSLTGCVAFELPMGVSVKRVQFALDGGLGTSAVDIDS